MKLHVQVTTDSNTYIQLYKISKHQASTSIISYNLIIDLHTTKMKKKKIIENYINALIFNFQHNLIFVVI